MRQVKSMAINPLFEDKQLVKLTQPTPKQHIHLRKGRGGQQFRYATTSYVQKVLNETFGWAWSFQVVDKGMDDNKQGIWVLGQLTIVSKETLQPMIIKQQFGGADIKYLKNSDQYVDIADDYKAAASDALKKCSSLLGICSDLYADPQTASEIVDRAEKVKAVIIEQMREKDAESKSTETE